VLTEITNDAAALANADVKIDLAANLFFGIASAIFVTFVLTFITARFVEGRMGTWDPADAGEVAEEVEELDAEGEAKGLRYALWATLAIVLVIALLTAIPGAPLRNPETGKVIGDSPFMDSLIVIIALIFFAAGLGYGHGAGTLKGSQKVLGSITKSWAGLASLLFLFLLIAQFIAYFNYSNMSKLAATALADLLERANIGALRLLVGFILLVAVIDLIMPGVIPKWRSSRRSSSRSSTGWASRRRPSSRHTAWAMAR
jgi:aminobenzoyl-glutamate transport protein